ncbi:DUF72 domain-containing protein [Phenylobacterium aquaticum]|uniref:DUF72 domain-containing protein n=1 Tax=Phenylobacterium aquaticum TaxID=1763816 RepID=UPI0026F09527|nr:DUF72 domain-containing protein [Phenylobacterium aquaticum]
MAQAAGKAAVIRSGMGGFTFEPWRGAFYPAGLRQADELAYATRHVTSIEINGTYYSSQKPETFAKWAATAPEGFVFALKASRFCTNRKVLAQGADSIGKFLGQGLVELGDKLGPILWQFMATKAFDPVDFEAFLDLLPASQDGVALRHCVEVRHASFFDPAFIAMCRARGVAISLSQNEGAPFIPDLTADFAYARLMAGSDEIETCYPAADLDLWARRFGDYAQGQVPADLTPVSSQPPSAGPRDVFAYFIREGKVRAPAGAMALLQRVRQD